MVHPFRRKYDWILYEYRLVEFRYLVAEAVAMGLAAWIGWRLAHFVGLPF